MFVFCIAVYFEYTYCHSGFLQLIIRQAWCLLFGTLGYHFGIVAASWKTMGAARRAHRGASGYGIGFLAMWARYWDQFLKDLWAPNGKIPLFCPDFLFSVEKPTAVATTKAGSFCRTWAPPRATQTCSEVTFLTDFRIEIRTPRPLKTRFSLEVYYEHQLLAEVGLLMSSGLLLNFFFAEL